MRHIVFKGQKYKHVVINIASDAPFHGILKQVNSITIPDHTHDDEHIRYALLELINNSLRAQREKGAKEKIRTEITVLDDSLNISITDHGGGFDINKLPYNPNEPPESVNTNDSRFQQYREDNQYKRFGMGLIVARRIFPIFNISFFNEDGDDIPYSPGMVDGTKINMNLRWNNA